MKGGQVDIDKQFIEITEGALALEADEALDKTLARVRTWYGMVTDEGGEPTLGALIRKCLVEDGSRAKTIAVMCAAMNRLIELEDQ